MVGKLWISGSIWHRAIEIWRILEAFRILITHPDRFLNSSWHCVLKPGCSSNNRWQNISQIALFFLFAANRQTFSGFFFPQLWLDRLWRWGRRLKSETRDAKLVWGDPHPHHHILLILMLPLWAWTGYNALIGFYRTLKLSTSFSFVHIWCLWE